MAYLNGKKIIQVVETITGKFKQLVDRSITTLTESDLEGLTIIGERAFSSCLNLTSVRIPSSVTKIDNWAFENCENLTSVIIPASVTKIGIEAFYGVYGEMTILATTPPQLSEDYCFDDVSIIRIPAGTLETYSTATNWSVYADKFIELEA